MILNLLKNTLVQILGKGITVGISLVTTGILTRGLGVRAYGQMILITSVLVLFDCLADLGTRIIGVREAAKKETEEEKRIIFTNVGILRLILSMISLVLSIVTVLMWSELRQIAVAAILGLAMIVFTSVAGSLEIIWQTKLKMELKVLVEILFPGLFFILLLKYGSEINLVNVFVWYLLARIASLMIGVSLIKEKLNISQIDKKIIFKLLKESWPMGLYLLLFSAYDRAVDSLMISGMVGVVAVAKYGLAYKIYGALLQPAYFLVSSVFPIFSSKSEGKKKIFLVSAGLLFWSALGVVIIIMLTAPAIVSMLAGEGFEDSVLILRILMGALVFSYFGHLFGFSLISRDGQKEMMKLGMVVLFFNLVANLIAIPRLGIVGAAVVTVLTEALGMMLMLYRLNKSR
jgi:O-antigen/teichoic acid export membrane protein